MDYKGLTYTVFHSPCCERIEDAKQRGAVHRNGAKMGPWAECEEFIAQARALGLPLECADIESVTDGIRAALPTVPAVVARQPDGVFEVWSVRSPEDVDVKLFAEGGALYPPTILEKLSTKRRKMVINRANHTNGKDVLDAVTAKLRKGETPEPAALNLALAISLDAARGFAPYATSAELQAAGFSPRVIMMVEPGNTEPVILANETE